MLDTNELLRTIIYIVRCINKCYNFNRISRHNNFLIVSQLYLGAIIIPENSVNIRRLLCFGFDRL